MAPVEASRDDVVAGLEARSALRGEPAGIGVCDPGDSQGIDGPEEDGFGVGVNVKVSDAPDSAAPNRN